MNFESILTPFIDEKYKEFHKKICNTKYRILGVKIPILRKIAKELLKKYDYKKIINNLNDSTYEHIMLQGLIIANLKISYKKKVILINNYLSKIDNWAICDIFCSELKFVNKNQKEFLCFLIPLLKKNHEYIKRFVVVMLLNYYINNEYIDFVLEKMFEIKSEYYYVKIAISWCLSICLIKYFDKTAKFMIENKNNFDKWIFNKALQKGIESFRISENYKTILKNMKI